jgi:hypothetical protein
MNPGPSNFTVTFSEDVDNPVGNTNIDDATNPNNYLLINKGANGVSNTLSCAGGVVADDTKVTVTGVTYNSTTFTSTVTLASALPIGNYRLFICGTTSILDIAGNALAGNGTTSGTDYVFDFAVTAPASSLPKTGFAPNRITSLSAQPPSLAYANLGGLWLEIPSLKVKASIVGVPKSNNTWDVSWLGNSAGWLNGTAYPSWEGNSVLTAHVTDSNGLPGPFANIKSLTYGGQIIVHLGGAKYIFEVRESKMISPQNSFLTHITCQWYNPLTDSYTFRRVVRAVLVSVQSE